MSTHQGHEMLSGLDAMLWARDGVGLDRSGSGARTPQVFPDDRDDAPVNTIQGVPSLGGSTVVVHDHVNRCRVRR